MKTTIRGLHVRLSPRLRQHVQSHLVRPLERFYHQRQAELEIRLIVTQGPKRGIGKECRATVFLPGTEPIHITERTDDLYKSIDFARDRLERAAKRWLDRRLPPGHAIRQRGHRAILMERAFS